MRSETAVKTCDFCGQDIDHGKEVAYPVEVWEYDEYNSGMCFSRESIETRCERCSR